MAHNPEAMPGPVDPQGLGGELLDALTRRLPEAEVTFAGTLPARAARHAPWPDWVPDGLVEALRDRGVERPYRHQAELADLLHGGRHAAIATGTSSGKSLGYLLPVLAALAEDPAACALYITPAKALGSDQLAAVTRLAAAAARHPSTSKLASASPAPYDGDTPVEARRGVRDSSRLVVTTPDMLHHGILPGHARWARLLRHLRFVVVDEAHVYRGVFGGNVALVLRRLRRLARHYGSDPVFATASATATEPGRHAARLIGEPDDKQTGACGVAEITEDDAPRGPRTVALWRPGDLPAGEGEEPVRRSASAESADIVATLVDQGARTIAFVRSRQGAESVALAAKDRLRALGRPEWAPRLTAYRAGYLAADRRRLERQLDDGTLLGVATTSALELGIDIGSLDAVVEAGFPGTVASFWQQAGRAGRRGQGSLVVFVGRDEPLDNYLLTHPDALLGRPVERAVFDPENPYLLRGHVLCAANEKPLTHREAESPGVAEALRGLEADGLVRGRPKGWFPTPQPAGAPGSDPHAAVGIRGEAGGDVTIVESQTGRVLGTVDGSRAKSQVHPGATHLHQGESFVVDELDLDEGLALVRADDPGYRTMATSETDIRVSAPPGPGEAAQPSPGLWLAHVGASVTRRVTGYTARLIDGTIVDNVPLDLPPETLETTAVAYTIDPLVLDELGIEASRVPGTLHAAEHAAIGLLPLVASCDRWDIGGVSTARHADTGLPTVFVYDGTPGGAGFSKAGFERFAEWIDATFEAVRSCRCESGCPSCIQSPKCGNGNSPLDKAGAIALLGALATMTGS